MVILAIILSFLSSREKKKEAESEAQKIKDMLEGNYYNQFKKEDKKNE